MITFGGQKVKAQGKGHMMTNLNLETILSPFRSNKFSGRNCFERNWSPVLLYTIISCVHIVIVFHTAHCITKVNYC